MCRVLILDDDKYSAETVKLILENSGEANADVVTTAENAVNRTAQRMRAGKPYEVFLIDQRLGVGKDGIDVFKDLRVLSPDSDGIIFTGYEDTENGLRAYEAGAFRYLSKPFENRELLFLLKAVKQWRKEQREHGWQKLFSGMMEAVLQQHDFSAVSKVIVNNSLKLGFERAHLFWVPTRDDVNKEGLLVGIACAGKGSVPNFEGRLYPLGDWYDLNRSPQSHNAVFRRQPKTAQARRQLEAIGYQLPAVLPLWRGTTFTGALVLDYEQNGKVLTEHEQSLLNLYARQVSVALDHASMYGREKWLLQESSIIRRIGRQITTKAVSVNLVGLLEEVRQQIGQLMDVSNFELVLYDKDAGEIDFRLFYQNSKRRDVQRRSRGQGLEEYLIREQKTLVLRDEDIVRLINENEIDALDKIPSFWLGIPLRVVDNTIGGIIIFQYGARIKRVLDDDIHLLTSVADQVAGAIQISRLSESEEEDAHRMEILHQASIELLKVARQKEEYFWFTVLAITTANFGIGFNRALLFLMHDNHRKLRGKVGIGTEDTEIALRDWRKDEKRNYGFLDFLREIGTKRMRHSPFESLVQEVEIELNGEADVIHQVIKNGKRIIVKDDDLQLMLPSEITNKFSLTMCALLPLRIGDSTFGLVIVDNKHNHKPLREKDLNRLQTLLDNASLIWETLRGRKISDSLLSVNQTILGDATNKTLKETLRVICETARYFSGADWAIIYPLLLGGPPYCFDLENIGHDGVLNSTMENIGKEQPSFGGISTHVLKKRVLKIEDVGSSDPVVKKLKLSDHHFIKSEGVKALIGAAIYDKYNLKPHGLFYLDYRIPRKFSDVEEQQILSFSTLAGVAISNARQIEELQQRRQLKIALEIAATVGTGLNLEKTMKAVLEKLHEVFKGTNLCILLYSKVDKALRFAPATLRFYKIQNLKYQGRDMFPINEGSIACRVAGRALSEKRMVLENIRDVTTDRDYLALNPKILSESCVSLMSTKRELLGVLVLERDIINGFDEGDADLIKTVGQHLSVAIERAQLSEALEFKSTVAAQTAWAADIAHEINNEVGQIRNWAFLIRNGMGSEADIQEYARNIEESASVLSSVGPWSDRADQIIELDPFLVRNLTNIVQHRNLETEIKTNSPGTYLKVNSSEFQHVLGHLVRNAARAMSNSAIKKIVVCTRLIDESRVEILFRDFGPGIGKNLRASIFQRQVTTKGRGGYGLLLVRQMIEDMQGEIRLLPYRKGQGTIFSIQFPISLFLESDVE